MRNFYLLCLVCMIFLNCKSKPEGKSEAVQPLSSSNQRVTATDNYTSEETVNTGYEDGEYCATIDYYNSSTGNSSTYTLEVEIENGELVKINWPNGGWLDSSHFTPPEIDADGFCSFSTFDGKDYEVQIDDKGGCSVSSSSPEDDEEEQIEEENSETEEGFEEVSYNTYSQLDLQHNMFDSYIKRNLKSKIRKELQV